MKRILIIFICVYFASFNLQAKTIIVLMDGTWNEPADPEDSNSDSSSLDSGDATNVELLDSIYLEKSENQTVKYYRGIGTDGKIITKIVDGGTGKSAQEKVQEAYNYISQTYNSDDKVVIFGFSRGATTARILANRLDQANEQNNTNIEISFLGLWDTVAALGVPESHLSEFRKEYSPRNKMLSIPRSVRNVVHYVALDEIRSTFQPTLLVVSPNTNFHKEIWFPGTHGDVGGGWPLKKGDDYKLSDLTLYCMLKEGLDKESIDVNTDAFAKLEDHVFENRLTIADINKKNIDPSKILGGIMKRRVESLSDEKPQLDKSVEERMRLDTNYISLAKIPAKDKYQSNDDCFNKNP